MDGVRVRFAPSPTGALHIGGVRTALFNYLFARKHGGSFILRIEDTDESRQVEWAEKYIIDTLDWLGITPDEGPVQGGAHKPYRQSERRDIYRKYAMQLVEEGKAYYAFDTAADLEVMREKLKAAKASSLNYNSVSRYQMKNSHTLSPSEVENRIHSGEPYVIRIDMPLKEEIRFHDEVRGWVVVQSSTLDDKILLKSDGMPTYHLANIVDDHLMGITHVIRGEEWLPSAPLHVLLYDSFGWEPPKFAHLPLLLKPDGNGKLSKRDADKHGFPIFPMEWQDDSGAVQGFKESGYYPEAVINFIALLGWNPGGEEELFDIDRLKELFSVEKVNKAGAKFDIEKAKWFNEHYLRSRNIDDLARGLVETADTNDKSIDLQKAKALVELLKERVTFESQLFESASFYFDAPDTYDEGIVSKKWSSEAADVLSMYADSVESMNSIDAQTAKEALVKLLEEKEVKMGRVMPGLRLLLTGGGTGPDLMGIIELLGGSEVAKRIRTGVMVLKDKTSQ